MRTGWVINVIDLFTKNQAFRMFFETKKTVDKHLETLKQKYDAITKDRFRVIIHSPYSEIMNDANINIKIYKKFPREELLTIISDVDPIIVLDDENYNIIEIRKQNLPKLFELMKDLKFELIK